MAQNATRRGIMVALTLVALLAIAVVLVKCSRAGGKQRLVEVFDNGPLVREPDGTTHLQGGPSEGFIWVGKDDRPPPGKNWRPVNYDELSAEQRQRIR